MVNSCCTITLKLQTEYVNKYQQQIKNMLSYQSKEIGFELHTKQILAFF